MNENGIRVAVILGSVRPDNYTARAAALVIDELRSREIHVDVIDPRAMDEHQRFAIREGGRTVGAGRVSQIIE